MPTIKDIRQIEFPLNGDPRGRLIAVEGHKQIPFEIKRIFYIYGAESAAVRGQHANKISEFVMVCVSGSCKVKITDTTGAEIVCTLDKPNGAIYVPNMTWKDMYDFSPGCVLLVFANTRYDGTEYIRDYNDFLKASEESL
jgi:dTDP-4-dehydrorhamnose 3,5-epimerase-like enzyme